MNATDIEYEPIGPEPARFSLRQKFVDAYQETKNCMGHTWVDLKTHVKDIGHALKNNPQLHAKNAANCIVPLMLLGIGALETYQYTLPLNERSPKWMTSGYVALGVFLRMIPHLNLPENVMKDLHNFFANNSFALFEILNQVEQQSTDNGIFDHGKFGVLLNEVSKRAIVVNGSQTFVGDLILAVNLQKGDRDDHSLFNRSLKDPVINHMLEPNVNDSEPHAVLQDEKKSKCPTIFKKQWFYRLILSAVGASAIGIAIFYPNSGNSLLISLGGTALTEPIGFFAARKIKQVRETQESHPNELRRYDDIQAAPTKLSRWSKFLRLTEQVIPRIALELIPLAFQIQSPWIGLAIGPILGAYNFSAKLLFQTLRADIYEAQKELNRKVNALGEVVKKTALKIDYVFAAIFLALFLAEFSYGAYIAQGNVQIGVIALLSLIPTLFAIEAYVEKLFRPLLDLGFWRRVINTLKFYLIENLIIPAVLFFILDQLAGANSNALRSDNTKLLIGESITALILFGFVLVGIMTNRLRINRENPAFSVPIARIRNADFLIQQFTGAM